MPVSSSRQMGVAMIVRSLFEHPWNAYVGVCQTNWWKRRYNSKHPTRTRFGCRR